MKNKKIQFKMLKRIYWYKMVMVLFLFLITCNVFSQLSDSKEPWFFIQLTDPQFGMFEGNAGFEQETVLYEKAVAGINRLKPDFIVITGDFVHNQNSQAQINEFKRLTSKINPGIPVYYTPGNHDIGQNPDKESLKKYHENYGSDRFVFQHKGSVFAGFNSSLIKARLEKQEQKQYKWLAKSLKNNTNADHIILFCHYPFFNNTINEPESYSNIGLEYRKRYLSLFEENGVEAVFSGHYHNNSYATYGKIQLVTTSALGKPLGKAPSGIRIVKIYSDRNEHEYFGLDELPEAVEFD